MTQGIGWLAALVAVGGEGCAEPDREREIGQVSQPITTSESVRRVAMPIEPYVGDASPARFVVRDRNAAAFFTDSGFALALGEKERRWGLDVTLPGARVVTPRPEGVLPGRVHSYVGAPEKWRTNLPTYERLVYDTVWPGVSLVVEPRRHGIEYRFEVAPGADADVIRLRWTGATTVRAIEKRLEFETGVGIVREEGLRCFEGKRDVPCRYAAVTRTREGALEVSFSVGKRDRSKALVIDPAIVWSTYLGGSLGEDYPTLAVDLTGTTYVTGQTYSADFPSTGGFDTTRGGTNDAVVTKISSTGTLVWSSYLGGAGEDLGTGITIDAGGSVFITGSTGSTGFPLISAFDTTLGGLRDAFVAKLRSTGTIIWSSFLGGSDDELSLAIAVDSAGNVVVGGSTHSPDLPSRIGFDSNYASYGDGFVSKVNASGTSVLWSTYLGGNQGDDVSGIAIAPDNSIFVTGQTSSPDFPVTGTFGAALSGRNDAYATKLSANGALCWSSYIGGSGSDGGLSVSHDAAGSLFVVGTTFSSDFARHGSHYTSAGRLKGDTFLVKLAMADGSPAWSSFLGGAGADYAQSITSDSAGNAYVTGFTTSTDFPTDFGFDKTLGGDFDAFITKVSGTSGTPIWSSYLGGSGDDYGYAVSLDGNGSAYVGGLAYGVDFPFVGAADTTLGGPNDYFVARIDISTPPGAPCANDTECGSGHCENAICCAVACDACSDCNALGTACDVIVGAGLVCRPATAQCDVPDACDGLSPRCPPDAHAMRGTRCLEDGNPCTFDACDAAAVCTHAAGNPGIECRGPTGECDLAESCTGSSISCPPDARRPADTACTSDGVICTRDVCDGMSTACTHPPGNAGTPCRPSTGECDIGEVCDGGSATCPPDARKPAETACAADDSPCTRDVCDGESATCAHPPGNTGTTCRPSLGECDPVETCSGVSADCPPDARAAANTACNDDGAICSSDVCDGSAATCTHPARASTYVCRQASRGCDVSESCDGSGLACPADLQTDNCEQCDDDGNPCTRDVWDSTRTECRHLAGNTGFVCRSAIGECDVAETCTGTATMCPADARKPSGTTCTGDALPCTRDVCNGVDAACSHPPAPSTTECRPAGGSCDLAEHCNGTSPECPADLRREAGAACEADGNACTTDECDGLSVGCQHPAGHAGAPCREAKGECDVAEVCTGVSPSCPPDAKRDAASPCADDGASCTADVCDGVGDACSHPGLAASFVCRPAASACDAPESCSGGLPACPDDLLVPDCEACPDDGNPCTRDVWDALRSECRHLPGNAGVPCRPSAGECDPAEVCTGVSAECPQDRRAPAGLRCEDDGVVCTTDTCNGLAATCTHLSGNAGLVCREAVDECDAPELCDGNATECPDDLLRPLNTPCADDENPCTRDVCDGAAPTCTHTAGNAGEPCRPSAGECDRVETCSGSSPSCPEDVRMSSNTACTDDGAACTGDVCDGASPDCTHPPHTSAYVCREAIGECDVAETCDGATLDCPPDFGAPDESRCGTGLCRNGACVPMLPDGGPLTGGNADAGALETDAGTGQSDAGNGTDPDPSNGCACGGESSVAWTSVVGALALRRRRRNA